MWRSRTELSNIAEVKRWNAIRVNLLNTTQNLEKVRKNVIYNMSALCRLTHTIGNELFKASFNDYLNFRTWATKIQPEQHGNRKALQNNGNSNIIANNFNNCFGHLKRKKWLAKSESFINLVKPAANVIDAFLENKIQDITASLFWPGVRLKNVEQVWPVKSIYAYFNCSCRNNFLKYAAEKWK